MDTRTNQWFLTLAEALHFGRAAERCNMSPSALTRAVKQLERQLGTRLFERDNRTVALTPAGELLRSYARESLSAWENLQQAIDEAGQQPTGTLSIYCSVTASHSFLYELLEKLRGKHPGIRFALQTGDPEHAIERVQSGDVQVSIGAQPAALPASFEFRHVASTAMVFIEALQGAMTRADITDSAEEWQQRPVIVPARGAARDRAMRWFRARGVAPQIFAEVSGNEAIVSMVSLSDGIGIVPAIVLENSPLAERVRVLSVTPALEPLAVGLFTLRKNLRNRLVSALWDETR